MSHTSDTAELYDGMAEHSKNKRARNRERSAALLIDRGVKFETRNAGAHLIVTTKYGLVDFWPGAGKFMPRAAGKSGRGVFNLLKLC